MNLCSTVFGFSGWRVLMLGLVLGGSMPAVAARSRESRLEHEFLWNEANALAASAVTEEDFSRVAERYRELARAGASNGVLYYNLGTALLQAGQSEAALQALARAERHMGSTVEIRRNMRLALAGDRDPADVFLPWYRLFLFWHYRPGFWLRLGIAAGAFAVAWLCMMLAVLGRTSWLLRAMRATALAVLILYSSSVGASLLQERRDQLRDRLIHAEETVLSDALGLGMERGGGDHG